MINRKGNMEADKWGWFAVAVIVLTIGARTAHQDHLEIERMKIQMGCKK